MEPLNFQALKNGWYPETDTTRCKLIYLSINQKHKS